MMAARIRTTPMVILHSFGLQTTLRSHAACGLTAFAVQALPAEKFVGIRLYYAHGGLSTEFTHDLYCLT
jgi:hypothetical protein